MTDLAYLLGADATHRYPLGLATRLRIMQMGGALHYRDPRRAEHNFRLDPGAVDEVLSRAEHVALVMSDHTFTPVIAIDADSPIYRLLAASPTPWAQLLIAHLDQWFSRFHPASMLHDPLALSAAVDLPFVTFQHREFRLEPDARMFVGPGYVAKLTTGVDYTGFLDWVHLTLRDGKPARPPGRECSLDCLTSLASESLRPAPPTQS
ncbi:Inosine/uridine-preferring nucleoside hydrolase domain-containing protein [Nocardia ninae]|uniref:Inosine/uridine-preferring nucleoside hydrolase domain-containing protein n=2 Tax=Nocardia ninae TaxID=356145 RepID=A0A511MHK0_9NOCA|nr:hypothetical protein NN4_44400 [Nocardia ninae NBRC 108245]